MNTWQEQALHHAKTSLPDESCGLVVDVNGKKEYFPCKNIAIEGVKSFTIDPNDWVKAEEMGNIIHICHSHPDGNLKASEEDIKSCDYIGLSWFIFNPIDDECIELKPKIYKPLLSRDKFIDRERSQYEQGLRKIKVYGRLAELVGWHVNYADVKNIKELYKYLICNYPEIEKYLNTAPILIGGGSVLAGSSIAILATIGSVLTTVGISMAISGVTQMLFPQQVPDIGDPGSGLSETDARVNYSFSGIQNVSRSGVCIPLIYGEVFCGSIVVSSGTDTAPVFRE